MIRRAAVAGKFYPGTAKELQNSVDSYLASARNEVEATGPAPKAIIAPHAGYIYSGPIAGTAYAYLARAADSVRRVVLLGPAHWVPVLGLAASSAEAFATPLGLVPVDSETCQTLMAYHQVQVFDRAHDPEHSLEVQLPFLQTIFADFGLVPLLVGQATPAQVAEVIEPLWDDPQTAVVVSSDLSHYQDYKAAVSLDRATSQSIESLRSLDEGQACGSRAINGLLELAKGRHLRAQTVDLRNSGDTAGPHDRVVGYGAFVFWENGQD